MQPILYNKVRKLVNQQLLKTLTVDIFDTILLHEYWPAGLRYNDIAIKHLPIFQAKISPLITAAEVYSWRMYTQQELRKTGRPLRLDLWFDAMISMFCIKYNVSLDDNQHLELLARLISTELEFEINSCKPNQRLIRQIAALKQLDPTLKVYFVADSAFTAEQIKTLLDICHISIFDGGICSSDLGATKRDGELYELLSTHLASDFDLMSNLHLGDQHLPDFLMPILHDSLAIHYRPLRCRGLRTLIGRTALKIIEAKTIHREQKRHRELYPSTPFISDDWQQYGCILAQAQALWSWQLCLETEFRSETNFLLSSTICTDISRRAPQLLDRHNVRLASSLDQDTMLRALVWLLATFPTNRWNSAKLFHTIAQETNFTNRLDWYDLCFTKDYPYSELAVNSYDDAEFWSTFLNEVASADAHYTELLTKAYENMAQILPRDSQDLCIITLHHDYTTELFRAFARLHGVNNTITEQVLDVNLDLAKSTNALQSSLNPRRIHQADQGAAKYLPVLQHTELAPNIYLEKVLCPNLRRISKTIK